VSPLMRERREASEVPRQQWGEDVSEAMSRRLNYLWMTSPTFEMARRGGRDLDQEWRDWHIRILRTEVDLRPAGRAVLREPASQFQVEIQFVKDPQWIGPAVKTITVVPDEPMDDIDAGRINLDLVQYLAAWELRLTRGPQGSHPLAPPNRPAPGKPVDTTFYQWLLRSYDVLLAEGHREPAKELARRMDEKHSTVKSWLRRGRQYLRKET
jgi:hypothetical protein